MVLSCIAWKVKVQSLQPGLALTSTCSCNGNQRQPNCAVQLSCLDQPHMPSLQCSAIYSAAKAQIHQVTTEKSFWPFIHAAPTHSAHFLLLILLVCHFLHSLYTSPSVSHPDSHSANNCPPGFKGSHTGTSVSMVTKDPRNLTKDFTVVLVLWCKHIKLPLAYWLSVLRPTACLPEPWTSGDRG